MTGYVVSSEHNYPNITVYRRIIDDVQTGWRINANEGYVMYDPTRNDTEIDPDTMEERPVTYYYTVKSAPLNYNWDNFHYIAVPRDSVDENYIFGGGNNNDHEVM